MDTKTTLPISQARTKIFDIAKRVQIPGTHYTFTEKGKPTVVMMSAEEFESWQETFEVMKDFPDLDKDIAQVERDRRSGKIKDYPTLEDVIKERKRLRLRK
ncbi:type II toxin-antitoxin system Phd/YefM family antitoxin [Candidatus Uhrbacteria bacterium]|nr:type II toxin-antitoxin system Phd/YefM family antitoxin [Candidatus Uhrbacteria bacterium]